MKDITSLTNINVISKTVEDASNANHIDPFTFSKPITSPLQRTFIFQNNIRGERERSPPLPQIMQSRFPHLRNSHGSAQPKCNG